MPSGGPSYGSYCCVSWCFNNGRTHKKPGTSFFRIPRDGRMKAWMQYAGRDDLLSKPASPLYATYRVCSDHFTAQSFMDPGHTRLTRMAVPSVQPAAPCSLSIASSSDCDMAAKAALQGPAVEASKSGSHTLRCPDEQGGSSLVAGEKNFCWLRLAGENLNQSFSCHKRNLCDRPLARLFRQHCPRH
ncbi:uncharacterized protein LOC142804016 [Rhipicephalus microplus]|uniref:uncharacterized protein LOC142803865 n=1 Tax=Rhipicephalus microplus TaxID=6941 RepID=UPI003F6B34D7